MNSDKIVLVVEDEPIIGFALVDMLRELGFSEIQLATTLAKANDFLEQSKIDIALLDVNVHGERSYGLANELRGRGVSIIFASGYGDAEHPDALKLVPTLNKPYNQEELSAALSKLL